MASKVDPMAEKMAQSSRTGEFRGSPAAPKKGDRFRCGQCGMEIQVTADCPCGDHGGPFFECCGQEMDKE